MSRLAFTSLVASFALACSGDPITQGLDQPIAVQGAQFKEGALPGMARVKGEEPTSLVASHILTNRQAAAGELGKAISGSVSDDAVAIAVAMKDAGSGYWVKPVSGPDVNNPGTLGWDMKIDVGWEAPVGNQELRFVAIGPGGIAGVWDAAPLCVLPAILDNGNACAPETKPPELVVSLGWNRPVDLDLRVVTPDGKIVDGKHPSTATRGADGKIDPTAVGTGILDGDSFAWCEPDGRQRENLVFQDKPAKGRYVVYANLYDSCGEAAVQFDASLTVPAKGKDPGTYTVKRTFDAAGALIAAQANGGEKIGTFITEFIVQ